MGSIKDVQKANKKQICHGQIGLDAKEMSGIASPTYQHILASKEAVSRGVVPVSAKDEERL